MPDMQTPPLIREIEHLHLPSYNTRVLDNGIHVYLLGGTSEPVMKLEMVIRAGASYEHKPAVAEVMAGLMSEGTRSKTSAELAEKIEAVGATLFTRGGVDTVRVRLLTLTRFFPDLIRTLEEVVLFPAFDERELKVYVENKIERIKIDLQKNEILAYRLLTERIFGVGHPYGQNVEPAHFESITRDDLARHHAAHIRPDKTFILLSGDVGDEQLDLLNATLGQWKLSENAVSLAPEQIFPIHSVPGLIEIDGPQKHQAAIRIGRSLFPQSHPDFNGMFMLNTILGGYFGSRLMNEIRENQGMTYGIYSSLDSFSRGGCMYISTETATTNADRVIESIHLEINKLRTELMPEEELRMARNYLMGHFMTQIDGSFATMDMIKTLKIENLDDLAFDRMIRTIREIGPEEIRDLAVRYFEPEEWSTIVVK